MYSLEIKSQDKIINKIHLSKNKIMLGSAKDCDVVLNYPTVSRKHATLVITEDEKILLSDCNSKNGTYLLSNNKKLIKVESVSQIELKQNFIIGPYSLSLKKEVLNEQNSNSNKFSILNLYQKIWNKSAQLDQEIINSKEYETAYAEVHGYGPIISLMQNPHCKEILINGYDKIFADLGQGLEKQELSFLSEESYKNWTFSLVRKIGSRLDLMNPISEGTLEDGSRIHIVIPPISREGISISIRRFVDAPVDEKQAIESGWITQPALELIKTCVQKKLNLIISGGTGSGKTTLLNFISKYIDPTERIIYIEDTPELVLNNPNCVRLVTRKDNADNKGEIGARKLIQSALRMRPDRIIVGECRGDEVFEMLQAMNTGHPGSISTVHANSSLEALERIELLSLLSSQNLSLESIKAWVSSSIDGVIHVEKTSLGQRIVSEISLSKKALEKINLLTLKRKNQEGPMQNEYYKVYSREKELHAVEA